MKGMLRLVLLLILLTFMGCKNTQKKNASTHSVNWEKRQLPSTDAIDSLQTGTTYLSVYSEIYSQTEHTTHNLTVTVSMRNTNSEEDVYIESAAYYDTHGTLIHTYFDQSIVMKPMETVEIVIDETDSKGGTGGNFIFDWKIQPNVQDPLFDAVMISTSGQQGLSFSTQGKRIQ